MKQYKMASITNPSIIKQPLKLIEIPLNKFSEDVIPHHQKVLEQHKANVHKLIAVNNVEQLVKETREKKKLIKQLRDLLYELDTLRTQVEDNDLDTFDMKTMPLRSTILKITKGYQELEKVADRVIATNEPIFDTIPDERINPFEGAAHIQIQADLNDLKLQQEQERLNRVEEVQQQSEDLEEIHRDLYKLVKDQGEQVDEVEINVAESQENVHSGFRNIAQANRLNAVVYPATGAFVGTLLGGPIGLLAGLKVGGIAAIGCAFAGYAGGAMLKKQRDEELNNESEHVINNENNENHATVTENEKKDI